MTPCDSCNKTILFGGERVGQFRFCSKACAIQGTELLQAFDLPDSLVEPELLKAHQSNCPKCGKSGPVDVHHYHSVWSMLILTRWVTKTKVCCRSCGVKAQAFASVFSLIFGWWGFPWGIIITPLQVGKNIISMLFPFSTLRPSKDLERAIRLAIIQAAKRASPVEGKAA